MLKRESAELPVSKQWLVSGFCGYTRRMVAKQFHAFGMQNESLRENPIDASAPVVVFANHSGWWDPIVAMLLREAVFPDRILYAPIDADALAKYRIMGSMGFYGLRLNTMKGAAEFLVRTQTILESPNASIWITPEGRFCDVRDHSQPLMPGLAHLAHRVPGVVFVPLAIEYTFWNESHPFLLTRFGDPIRIADANESRSKREWSECLTHALRSTQDQLAKSVIARDANAFCYLIGNRSVRRSWYDYARSWSSWWEGKPFDPRHDA